jgi:uncharacterized membrane protein YqjE
MLRQLLLLTGVEQRLHAVRQRLEARAQAIIQQGKSVAMQVAIAAGLATGAIVILLLAVIAGLIVLFLWLAPHYGNLAAAGIVGALLLAIAVLLAICAYATFMKKAPPIVIADIPPPEAAPLAADPGDGAAPREGVTEPPMRPISLGEVDAMFSLAGRYGRMPQTGIEPIDNLVRAVSPKAEEATREAVARAANLMRHGDRTTMLTVLGAAVAAGWLLTKVHQKA